MVLSATLQEHHLDSLRVLDPEPRSDCNMLVAAAEAMAAWYV